MVPVLMDEGLELLIALQSFVDGDHRRRPWLIQPVGMDDSSPDRDAVLLEPGDHDAVQRLRGTRGGLQKRHSWGSGELLAAGLLHVKDSGCGRCRAVTLP